MSEKLILLIEDNLHDEVLTLRALRKSAAKSEIDVVRDGAEAWEYLSCTGRHSERDCSQIPSLVLLDLKLPKVDGLEVLRRIRDDSRTRLLPVVVLTSSVEANDITESYRLGANSYVRKQVDFLRFEEIVDVLSRYWLGVNELPPRADWIAAQRLA